MVAGLQVSGGGVERVTVSDITAPELHDYTRLTDVALRRLLETERGLYMAESLKVLERALAAGHVPRSVLVLEKKADAVEELLSRYLRGGDAVPLYLVSREQSEMITGFDMHRGVVAAMHRPEAAPLSELLAEAKRVVVLDGLDDHSNVGLAFRSAAALGADAVLLTPTCADALYRRSIRLSMGTVFQVPWARLPEWPEAGPVLREAGFHIAAFALRDSARTLEEFAPRAPEKLALVFGNEGRGLDFRALGAADTVVQIPMDLGVDSLNVATSVAVALWAFRSSASQQ